MTKRNAVSLSARIPVDLYLQLEEVAEKHGVAVSAVVRMAVARGLDVAATDREIAEAIDRAVNGSPDA